MKYSGFVVLTCGLFSIASLAQSKERHILVEENNVENITNQKINVAQSKIEDPSVYLDSIKATFVNHKITNKIEKQWLNKLNSSDIYEEIQEDIESIDLAQIDDEYDGLTTDLLKERLQLLNEKTPFNVEYNETLEKVIKSFLKKRKRSFERLMGASEYYFPLFEEKLAKYNVPLEVKYLSIVESALNPNARSRVGATGLWQFMYATGKQYKLEVNSFVDERIDPVKSSDAAAKFMSDLYRMFGDWDLVLASYNAGPGNVTKAMRRSGEFKNYWNIRHNLPRETQNYLPAFYATMYMFEYAKEHGINADKTPIQLVETDTIAVKRAISFDQISKLLDITNEEIEFLNPTYKLKFIPYVSDKVNVVRLPIDRIGIFASNEDKIYAYVDFEESKKEKPIYNMNEMLAERSDYRSKYHTIRKGESVGIIAQKYGLTVAQLKKMNNMKSNTIYPGKKLIVGKTVVAQASASKGFYTVQKGDSLYSISRKIPGVTIARLCELNNMQNDSPIHPGMKLKIK
ncbi:MULTISPECIES: lytic transglycosylase domain-containing protein [Myroides]|uniref:LysM peptidoglycan-binding domain-containing protein n=1 Tax=Myroides albus TaxID=2562892 RepID=A0A6I3LEH8_9FLAO|nr:MULTISPECIES: lytic transglycosylase domain-containing protein [Myroides]MTG97869.1 LysM peptidoglycan-binding domain-containing protein [Myroides albus]MVX34243.1 LysM peptidoglycan-binding domain-containing protein [Myroides sp. LoEW2-1]UVD81056.1 LysM peptidoglycan-binding domain-containing protein [Myroides albus]